MLTLYHEILCPFSRTLRLLLSEKNVQHMLSRERVWERSDRALVLVPQRSFPLICTEKEAYIVGVEPGSAYIAERYNPSVLFPSDNLEQRAEIRRLSAWFHGVFYQEVGKPIVDERLNAISRAPRRSDIRNSLRHINDHFDYIDYLLKEREGLVCEVFTLADFCACAHISCVEYMINLPWERYPRIKMWYMRLKSRPSFRPFLFEQLSQIKPTSLYKELDL